MAPEHDIPTPTSGRKRGKVLVAMSGGVDSSVAAALLLEQGYDVLGAFMRLGEPPEPKACKIEAPVAERSVALPVASPTKKNKQGCCSVNDAHDARSVAAQLGIPLYVLNFRERFERVIDYFTAEYNAGRTPNPCVRCNDWLKLGSLYDKADELGCDYIATGHHARVIHPEHAEAVERSDETSGASRLVRGIDHPKDQSYVLFGTRRDRLARTLLPVGEYTKAQVREIAERLGLETFDKPDSQEICFVPDQDYARVVEGRTPDGFASGPIVDTAGRVLAEHSGHQHYTLGQRRGLGIAAPQPLYVVRKDADTNTVTVGTRNELGTTRVVCSQSNWLIDPPAVGESLRVGAQIRSHGDAFAAELTPIDEDVFEVAFDQPVAAATPGQALVAYDGDTVIGGGWIDSAE